MEGPLVRGYWLLGALGVLEDRAGREVRERVWSRLPAEVQSMPGGVLPGTWCPRTALCEVLRGVAQASENRADDALVACGREAGSLAFDTFLHVVMNLATAKLFVKKLPAFWDIDYRHGGVLEGGAPGRVRASGISGFDYIGPAYAGWLQEGLRRKGTPVARVVSEGWSWDQPGPESVVWVLE
jgi:hypothetical protein